MRTRDVGTRWSLLGGALVSLFVCAPACADPGRDAVRTVAAAFRAVHSYRGTLLAPSGDQAKVEFVAPDRYRMHTPMGDVVIVGATTYLNVGGKWLEMSMPQVRDSLATLRRPAASTDVLARAKVTDLGAATLDRRPVHRWKIVTALNGSRVISTMWVGIDELPYRNDIITDKGRVTVLYSDYNAPIKIAAPY